MGGGASIPMKTAKVKIINKRGMHARAAAKLVHAALADLWRKHHIFAAQ